MNLAQMQQQIVDHGYDTSTAPQQLSFLNATYREIHGRRRWKFLEATDSSLSTVQGVNNVSLAGLNGGAWRNLDAVRVSVPATQQFPYIEYKQPQDILDLIQTNPLDQATPMYWSFYAQKLWFYPTPDQAYTITISYINEPVDLAAAGDVPVIPVPYHDLLVAGAICRIAFRERDWIGLELWTQKFKDMFDALDEEYRIAQRQTSSEVKRSGWWNTEVTYPLTSTGF